MHLQPIKAKLEFNNKILERGLSYYLSRLALVHDDRGTYYVSPNVTDNPLTNPFEGFAMCKSAARPDYTESNSANNANAGANGSGVANTGIRYVDKDDTTGPGIKMLSRELVNQGPGIYYTDMFEYVFYAQDNPGGAVETGADGIDNYQILGIGWTQGPDCGNGGTQSRWGLRQVLGTKPTHQGSKTAGTDRISVGQDGGVILTEITTATIANGFIESGNNGVGLEGSEAFDGATENEVSSSVFGDWLNDSWQSANVPGPHYIGRVFATQKTVHSIRIATSQGASIDNIPDDFKIQYLPLGSTDPRESAGQWVDCTGYGALVDQAGLVAAAGPYGYEYILAAPRDCLGIRLSNLYGQDHNVFVDVAELMIFEEHAGWSFTSAVDDAIRLSTDGGVTPRTYNVGTLASTQDMNDIVEALNDQLFGYELEAVRSTFGFLWIRGSTHGLLSLAEIHAVAASMYTKFGLSAATIAGTDETITKLQNDTLTFIYRQQFSLLKEVP
jgi:hypothetical protein